MEIDDTEDQSSNKIVKVAENVWMVIQNGVEAIFSNLKEDDAEKTLCELLESILRGSTNLINVLVPPCGAGPRYEIIRRQYTAFTTWLFGMTFHTIGEPLSDKVLSCGVKVQACVLNILHRHSRSMLSSITSEYIKILDELLDFYESNRYGETIVIKKFIPDGDIIDCIDLAPFVVNVKYSSLSCTLVSIMKIILQSGIQPWRESSLWIKMIKVLLNSEPAVKIYALEIALQFANIGDIDNQDWHVLLDSLVEIIKFIPEWERLGLLDKASLPRLTKVLIESIEVLDEPLPIMTLCFNILEEFADCNSTELHSVQEAACCKIEQHLYKHPRSCTPVEFDLLKRYTRKCWTNASKQVPLPPIYLKSINNIAVSFVLNDVKTLARPNQLNLVSELSELWSILNEALLKNIQFQAFDQVWDILRSFHLLDAWLAEENVTAQLFGRDFNRVLSLLLDSLRESEAKGKILESMVHLLSLREADKEQVQLVLSMPWNTREANSPEIRLRYPAGIFNNLETATRVSFLEALCELGEGKWRLRVIRDYILSREMELGIAGILNSVWLLNDSAIRLDDLSEYVLEPALESRNAKFHEALVMTLGRLLCFLSDSTSKARNSWYTTRRTIECHRCDGLSKPDPRKLPSDRFDDFLRPYLSLFASESDEVRYCVSMSLIRFVNHSRWLISPEVIRLWMPYLKDPRNDIRSNLPRTLGSVIRNEVALAGGNPSGCFDEEPASLQELAETVVNYLDEILDQVIETGDFAVHKTLLDTAEEVARVPLISTERDMLGVFFTTMLSPNVNSALVSHAVRAYHEVARFRKVSPKVMYVRYRNDFVKLMMSMAVNNYIEYSCNVATSLHRAAMSIGYQDSKHLLMKDGHRAVCFLVPLVLEVPKAVDLFRDMAEVLSTDEKEMLTEYFKYICPHVMLNESPEVGSRCLKLVSRLTNLGLPDLARDSFMGIFDELLLYIYKDVDKTIRCLEVLVNFDGKYDGKFDRHESVVAYLWPRLHGILVNLDMHLGARFDEHTQRSALASLATLIRFMGPRYVTPLRYKILASLRTSIGFKRPGFRLLACDAWDAFLHNTSIKDLGPLLPTICVSVAPLFENYPQKTDAMLAFLLLENGSTLVEHVGELFFVDDLKVSQEISNVVKAHISQTRPMGVEAELKQWLRRIAHETEEVRLKALVRLQGFLADHRTELNDLVLEGASVHPLIVELLDALFSGCRDKHEAIRLASGECLGELGAVEPGLLPRRIACSDDTKFIAETNEEFACALLEELVRAFQAQKSTHDVDCVSLAIQETLLAYDISPQGRNCELWNSFSSTVQQMIFPFLTSHYVNAVGEAESRIPHPIYGSEAGSTFNSWAYNWVCAMSCAIEDKRLRTVLNACRPAFRKDSRTLAFCVPHVVAHTVTHGTAEQHTKLIEEILAVLKTREESPMDERLFRWKPLRLDLDAQPKDTRVSDEARRIRCSQVVFSTLEHLQRWIRERRGLRTDEQYTRMKAFCSGLDELVLAEGCYRSHEYYRALRYLEGHMSASKKGLSEPREGGLLAKIYMQIEEPDGVSGILATQGCCPTTQQQVLSHVVSGRLQDAATCYERLAWNSKDPKYIQGMIQCYIGLDQPFTAISIIRGILGHRPELEPVIVDDEPLWRLADFNQLDDSMKASVERSLLDELKRGARPDLLAARRRLHSLLGTTSQPGAYQQSYSCVMKLHVLNEFDKSVHKMTSDSGNLPGSLAAVIEEWEKRGRLVRASRGAESVLGMRRAALDLVVRHREEAGLPKNPVLEEEIGKIWLQSAKMARKAGFYQQAYMYILSATDRCPPQELHVEQAQLYWEMGRQEEAFVTLNRCFSNYFEPVSRYKQTSPRVCTKEQKQCAKAKLLFAKYNDETLNVDTETSIANYKEAVDVWPAWEKSLLCCARYHESVVDRMTDEERDTKGWDLQMHMLNYYGKSLQYGCKYIHQSMPRMLTIWLDFASRRQSSSDCLSKMTNIIEVYLDRLPTFMWLTAFSQLVSRMFHPARIVRTVLSMILVKLIVAYPQRCLWMMASVLNSSYPARRKRCQEILSHEVLKSSEMTKLIGDFYKLWDLLIEVSNKKVNRPHGKSSIKALSKNLPRLLASSGFGPIMVPTTKFRHLHLPSKGDRLESHDPFPTRWAQICGIEDEALIMFSQQQPKRIGLKGSDGLTYLFMCKPKDDLRKDFRFMEFNDVVNKYLQKDPESRQRRLYIRTFSVAPLNEECGLVEWIPNLVGLRPILMGMYKSKGLCVPKEKLLEMLGRHNDPLEKKKSAFLEKLIPSHPPVLGEWFRSHFPDAYSWYEARAAFIRTTAVMSMVGYILGLGDRHGENVLIDSKTGDCVHVDFNCIFNRGERLRCPERVPFRLTHNMVEAMGPLKYDGPFRKCCQITMRVLQQEASTLISVLRPFVYDPLVTGNEDETTKTSEQANAQAVHDLENIERRLHGFVRIFGKKVDNVTLNLSVEGQVNHLIQEAVGIDNLCQMYSGWGPFL
ncbi:serine/threonine-protein kinase ATR [Orussus abietinus]|uniref:serine/threonine-protein kinase ATR n=1 Tax=Orussus abietinus TaxID=222816 RepID=UPI0006260E99|nr:serine/threonine-protein kinase ATR [Orussus abietinus]